MALITYEDKEFLNKNEEIADNRKVNDTDLNQIKNAINNLFPVGFIIEVDNADFNPNTYWGGTWERDKGHVIVSVDEDDTDFNTSGKIGGEKEHTLTIDEMPFHKDGFATYNGAGTMDDGIEGTKGNGQWNSDISTRGVGGNQPHNNMPPYRTAYRWIKTAM